MAKNYDRTAQGSSPMPENDTDHRIEAIENTIAFDVSSSDLDSMSDVSSLADSDSEDCPLDKMRLQQPTKYFRELNNLESEVFGNNSTFNFYINGTPFIPFDGHSYLKVGEGGRTSFRKLKEIDVKDFHREVLSEATEAVSQIPLEHYSAKTAIDCAVENMFHLIECRNILLWAMKSVEAMEKALYCGTIISILVIDKTDHNVARLLPIQCSKIKQLVNAFEDCLTQLIGLDRSMILVDTQMTVASDISEVCLDLLSELDLDVSDMHCTEIWRCAVHVVDMAVLSYAGAHTQFFGMTGVKCITLPGPFLETQYFVFRRRSFLCLGEFLGGHEAWVLERHRLEAPQLDLPPLYLSTDVTTFGDIWGPIWKTYALLDGQADHNHILQYSVGNGLILPWNLPSSGSQDSIGSRKGEVFCHWISDKDIGKIGSLESSGKILHPDDILLIGASMKLGYNECCNLLPNESRQRLRDAGSLSEIGTRGNSRAVDSETVQIQVGAPTLNAGAQRTYKRRGRTWKEALIENWKNNSEGRNVRMLEYRLGVEVSACTYNARRRRLITLLGSKTMTNHLRNGSLRWNSTDCEEKFYAALESSDHKAFRKLYLSQKDWQPDLGKAITHCLDGLIETGVNEKSLNLLWVPDSELGQRVNIRLRKHSWIGFLKDTEDCCTMAIFEDKCLELPNLSQVRKCHNRDTSPELTINSRSDQILEVSVLETSFLLNERSVPNGMQRIPCHGHNHGERWSTSSLEAGEKFHFGEKGQLKYIKSLGNSRILANWKSSWELLELLKEKFQLTNHDMRHWEYIREEKANPRPISALVMSSEPEKTTPQFTTSATPSNPFLGPDLPAIYEYAWVSSDFARPRGLATPRQVMKQTVDRFIAGELASSSIQERVRSRVDELVAGISLPLENNREQEQEDG